MRPFKQVGPFGRVERFFENFAYNAERQRIFMELLEELDKMESIIKDEETAPEEKQVAQYLYDQLEEQFVDMITPASSENDKTGSGKNL